MGFAKRSTHPTAANRYWSCAIREATSARWRHLTQTCIEMKICPPLPADRAQRRLQSNEARDGNKPDTRENRGSQKHAERCQQDFALQLSVHSGLPLIDGRKTAR